MLPLLAEGRHRSALVWTLPPEAAEEMLAAEPEAFGWVGWSSSVNVTIIRWPWSKQRNRFAAAWG